MAFLELMIAVAEDLYTFAVDQLFGRKPRMAHVLTAPDGVMYLAEPAISTDAMPNIPPPVRESFTASAPRKNTVMYAATIDVPLRLSPHTEAEMITTLSYGTMLMVLDSSDGWSKVISGEREGWVLTDDLADRAAYVYPQFVIGESNFAEDPNTLRLRAMIGDAFKGGAADRQLMSEEYVLYKLLRRGIRLSIPGASQYEKGYWSTLLREIETAAVSPEPKPGAVMQLHFPEDASLEHFAYIEAVFPDDSIQISEVGWPEDGIYNERMLVKEEWYALSPVFFVIA